MNYTNNHFSMKCNSYVKQRIVRRAISLQRGYQGTTAITFLKEGAGNIDISFSSTKERYITYFYICSLSHGGVFLYPKNYPKLRNDYERDSYRALVFNAY